MSLQEAQRAAGGELAGQVGLTVMAQQHPGQGESGRTLPHPDGATEDVGMMQAVAGELGL